MSRRCKLIPCASKWSLSTMKDRMKDRRPSFMVSFSSRSSLCRKKDEKNFYVPMNSLESQFCIYLSLQSSYKVYESPQCVGTSDKGRFETVTTMYSLNMPSRAYRSHSISLARDSHSSATPMSARRVVTVDSTGFYDVFHFGGRNESPIHIPAAHSNIFSGAHRCTSYRLAHNLDAEGKPIRVVTKMHKPNVCVGVRVRSRRRKRSDVREVHGAHGPSWATTSKPPCRLSSRRNSNHCFLILKWIVK